MNDALAKLKVGNWREGFALFEQRASKLEYNIWQTGPQWTGQDLTGKTIVLHAEQGYGDTIHMARYLPVVKALGAQVIVAAPKAVVRLLRGCEGVDTVCGQTDWEHADYRQAMLSLPLICGTEPDRNIPPPPRLTVRSDAYERFASVRGELGYCWKGNPKYPLNHERSIPRDVMESFIDGVSLTFGEGGLIDTCKDYADTAALIANLSGVVTVDTSVAHLAGSMGKPTILILGHESDWRWLEEREDTPWYPSVRIVRRQTNQSWFDVMQTVAALIAA